VLATISPTLRGESEPNPAGARRPPPHAALKRAREPAAPIPSRTDSSSLPSAKSVDLPEAKSARGTFDVTIMSARMGLRKRHARSTCSPPSGLWVECLCVDDLCENVRAAEQVG
jgi:hypothetical protein